MYILPEVCERFTWSGPIIGSIIISTLGHAQRPGEAAGNGVNILNAIC